MMIYHKLRNVETKLSIKTFLCPHKKMAKKKQKIIKMKKHQNPFGILLGYLKEKCQNNNNLNKKVNNWIIEN
jgi:hypothetical protein